LKAYGVSRAFFEMNAILRIEAQRGTSRRALGVFELLANIAEAESVF
jgi:hypothetical protein